MISSKKNLIICSQRLVGWLCASLAMVLTMSSLAHAQSGQVTTNSGYIEWHPPVQSPFLSKPPLTPEEIARLKEGMNRVRILPPVPVDPRIDPSTIRPMNPPTEVTEFARERDSGAGPMAPGDFTWFENTALTTAATNDRNSNRNEPSFGAAGNVVFWTGNWYASVSTDGGQTFSYIDPADNFPADGIPDPVHGGFCCDQIAYYERTRGMMFWLLQYLDDGNTNAQRIAIADSQDDVANNTWYMYDFRPGNFGWASTGFFLDFPDLAMSDNYLYYTTNVFTVPGDVYSGAVIVRIALDDLFDGGTIQYEYITTTLGGWRMTQGATTTMYFGQHISTSRIRLYEWDEGSNSVYWNAVDHNGFIYGAGGEMSAPTIEDTGDADAGPPGALQDNAKNWTPNEWAGHTVTLRPGEATEEQFEIFFSTANTLWIPGDWVVNPQPGDNYHIGTYWLRKLFSRILGAWVADGVIGFMWTGAQGGGFPYPQVQVLRINESTRGFLSQGQIHNPDVAWVYPSVHPNDRGDIAGTIAFGGGSEYPSAAAWIADDYNGDNVTPAEVYLIVAGDSGPPQGRSDRDWGDYLTARRHVQSGNTWGGSAFAMVGGMLRFDVSPRYVWFGRERDTPPATNMIYVNWSNATGLQNGTSANPYNNVNAGAFAGKNGDTIRIQAGNYTEVLRISGAVTLTGQGGNVIIGQ